MEVTVKQAAQVAISTNKEALKASARMRAGKMVNDRVITLVKKQVPFPFKSYVDTSIAEALIPNIVATAIIKYLPNNAKAMMAAEAMMFGAADDFVGSFNVEGMINDVLDGIDLSSFKETSDDVRETTGSVLRKASEFVEPESREA